MNAFSGITSLVAQWLAPTCRMCGTPVDRRGALCDSETCELEAAEERWTGDGEGLVDVGR